MKRDQPDLSGANIFTVPSKIVEKDVLPGGPFFTDSNMVTNSAENVTGVTEPGRTLNGEPVSGVDDTQLAPDPDPDLVREFNDAPAPVVEVVNPEMLRDLNDGDDDNSPLAGIDWKSNGLVNAACLPNIFLNSGTSEGAKAGWMHRKGDADYATKQAEYSSKIADQGGRAINADALHKDAMERHQLAAQRHAASAEDFGPETELHYFHKGKAQGHAHDADRHKKQMDAFRGYDVENRSLWPTIFLSNKKMPDSLVKATAVRRGATALTSLKNGAAPVGFTGHVHPLTDAAEHLTTAALAGDEPEAHEEAAEAHENAGKKMAGFMKQTGPGKHKDHPHKMRGLSGLHEHHTKRAALHRDRAAYLGHKQAVQDAEDKAAEKEAKDKKKAKK